MHGSRATYHKLARYTTGTLQRLHNLADFLWGNLSKVSGSAFGKTIKG